MDEEDDTEFFSPAEPREPRLILPPPWLENWETSYRDKTYSFLALDRAHKMTEEGERMKNCVNTYRKDVASGICYIYSLRVGDKRKKSIATIELKKREEDGIKYYISQARGPCNQKISSDAETAIGKWCKHFEIARSWRVPMPELANDILAEFTGYAATGTAPIAGTAWNISLDSATTTSTATMGAEAWTQTTIVTSTT